MGLAIYRHRRESDIVCILKRIELILLPKKFDEGFSSRRQDFLIKFIGIEVAYSGTSPKDLRM
jgi:hypothetical protein